MDFRAMQELAAELPLIEDHLRRTGLYRTAFKMNEAVKEIGFEIENNADAENQRTAALR